MKRGFTNIELIFVIGVSLLVIAAMLGGFVNFLVINEHNRNMTLAANIARDLMEAVNAARSRGEFDSITSMSYTSGQLQSLYGVPANWGTCARTVTDVSGTNGNLKFITISVSWNERGRQINNGVVLNSAVARR